MSLEGFPDGEGIHGPTFEPAPVRQRIGHGVGTHRESAHPAGFDAPGVEGVESDASQKELALGTHGGAAGIDVIVRTGAAGQGKLTQGQGPFHQKCEETGTVIHVRQLPPLRGRVKARGTCEGPARPEAPAKLGPFRCGSVQLRFALLAVLVLPGAAGCGSDPVELPEPRFAQVGEVQVEVLSRMPGEDGLLEEAFLWRAEGPWVLVERVNYAGRPGAQTVRRPTLNPGELAPEYTSLVRQLNDTPGLRLFDPEVPRDLVPTCAPARSRIVVTLRDTFRDEEARWVRCVDGNFFTASSGTAGPDAGAARVVTAAQLARFFTVGEGASSTYAGSRPFYTLDRGEDSPARASEPAVFRSDTGEAPEAWEAFWASHAAPDALVPIVDWDRDMVLLAAVGRRPEAGEAVRIQRVLPIDQGTRIEVVRTVPGDFCSPAAKEIYPYDIVVARRTEGQVLFNEPLVERIPCGL